MQFKITKMKMIGSILIPLIIEILVFIIGSSFTNPPSFIRAFLEIHNLVNIFSIGNLSLLIIEIIIVYLIWSLFQKEDQASTPVI